MTTLIKQHTAPKPLLEEAFQVLLENLGAEKTTQLWSVLGVPSGDYVNIRKELFKGKDIDTLSKEITKFNRK